jgi:hypothetical protein
MVHGDRFILCSDGLVDEVNDEEIAAIAGSGEDPQATAERLVAKANANGGSDNVTVVVVDVLQGVEPSGDDAHMQSEPGWSGSDSTVTLIDADANSDLSTVSSDIDPRPASPVHGDGGAASSSEPRRWGARTVLKLVGAAVVLTVIATLIAVAVNNRGDGEPSPTTVTTEPDTVVSTSSSSSTSSTTSSTSSTVATVTTVAGTAASNP